MSAPFKLSSFGRKPYCDLHPRFLRALDHFAVRPTPEQYDELAGEVPRGPDVQLPRFVREDSAEVRRLGGYEQHVAELRAVPMRPESWHDFFNMTVWAHFPKLRWALNALHIDPNAGLIDPRNGRAPAQNVAATFDEAGMIVVSSNRVVLETLRGLHFKQAFWVKRAELLASTRFWVVGHGLLESLLTPHSALAARSLKTCRMCASSPSRVARMTSISARAEAVAQALSFAVLVVAAPPHAVFVAAFGGAVEPLVHAP